jgi:hypothetical protein
MSGKNTSPESPRHRTVIEFLQSDTDRVARFYERLLGMKSNELAAELEASREAFENDKSELNRLQLALLLSLPGTSFRDDGAAMTLLNPFIKEMRDKSREGSALRPLGVLLYTELLELRRADEMSQQHSAKLKDEQRHAEALQQRADTLQLKSDALQQKLEAILDMEMKMIEREQNLPKKK